MPIAEITQTVSPKVISLSVGTFTFNPSTVGTQNRNITGTPGASTVLTIPFSTEKIDMQFGAMLTKILLPLRFTTANLSALPTVSILQLPLYQATLGGSANNVPVAIPATISAGLTAAATDTAWTVSVTTPAFDNTVGLVQPVAYEAQITIPCASSTVLTIYDPVIYFNKVANFLI